MDLHDFTDVAMNYDLYLKALSLSNDCFEEFYLSVAKDYGNGGIIDIACGTGVLTIPFAKAGYDVTAMDLSKPMIDVTREKLQNEMLQANLFVANMTDFKIDSKFSLAVIARSGFMHLLSPKEQKQALINIKFHLKNDGILTLNTFQPNPIVQAGQMQTMSDNYTLRTEYINKDGKKERIYNAIHYDYLTQIMSGNWKFETLDEHENVIDTRIRPLAMRQTYRQEMEYLFELCGFEIIDVYGDFLRNPTNGNYIWVVRKIK